MSIRIVSFSVTCFVEVQRPLVPVSWSKFNIVHSCCHLFLGTDIHQGAEFLTNPVLGEDAGWFLVTSMAGLEEFMELFQDDQVQGCMVI